MSDEFDTAVSAEEQEEAAEAYMLRRDYSQKKKALLTFYIVTFSVVLICAILRCVFVFFKVDTVRITGGESYRQEDILSICNIQEGDNLVLLATGAREDELEYRFPYIEKVEIKKRLPSTVEVTITETKTAYSIESQMGYLYVNHSGKVLEVAQIPCTGSAVVRGTTPTATGPSQIIGFEDEEDAMVFGEIIGQLREKDVAGVTDIDMRNRYDVTMTYNGRIRFKFGNTASMQSKMAYGIETLNYLIDEGSIAEDTYGEMDLTMVPDKKKVIYAEVVPGMEQDGVYKEIAAGRDLSARR